MVDDDYHFRLLLEKSLLRNGHEVICAENGKQAQDKITNWKIDIVISDIRMPEMNGVDLLKWTKASKPNLPVILITGFSELVETQDAAKLGASGFLAKPFKTNELLEVINAAEAKNDPSANLDGQYCKIGIDDFTSGKEIKFDIYIRLSPDRYVKIAHGGENLSPDRIKIYKDKNIRFLYLTREDFNTYIGFNLKLAGAVAGSKTIDPQKKINFLRQSAESLVQALYSNEIGEEAFAQVSTFIENAITVIGTNPDGAQLLEALNKHSDYLFAHSVAVSFYSTLIGGKLGLDTEKLFKLSVAALLHDIGKKELPKELLEKAPSQLTANERNLIQSHPRLGTEILLKIPGIPSDICVVANEHHENGIGTGYPDQFNKDSIHPLSKVVACANDFCNLVLKSPHSLGMRPVDAIKKMVATEPGYYDQDTLSALIGIFPTIGKSDKAS